MTDIKYEKKSLVFLHREIYRGETRYVLLPVEDAETGGNASSDNAMVYKAGKKKLFRIPAGIYECTFTEGSTRMVIGGDNAPKFVGKADVPAETKLAWEVEDRSVEVQLEAKNEERKTDVMEALHDAIAPLHAIYLKASPQKKRAIEVLLVNELRKPKLN